MVTDRWTRKIVALFHDPPDKPFGIGGHERRASELVQIVLGRVANADEANRAKRADQIASAADRVDFPERDTQGKYLSAYWQQEKAVLTHPLAGGELDLGSMIDVSVTETLAAARSAVEQITEGAPDTRTCFLRLWRSLPDQLAQKFPRVGALFGMLPAETRQPDHPLHQHLSITAAIADALPQPALIVFSIGPVQEFIAAARRTQDLWMGSWLLAYLSWTAMLVIAEEYGPDVITFPSLREQPLCDWWLNEQGIGVSKPDSNAIILATLPNKFVALLPASEAESAAQKAEQAVGKEWKRLSDKVLETLSNGIMPADDVTRQMWREQVSRQLEIYWTMLPWPGANEDDGQRQAEAVKKLYEELIFAGQPSDDWEFGKIYALFARSKAQGGGQYDPNWGTVYNLLYSLADRAFNARKSLRDFLPSEEHGEKCTVCGQRSALHGKDGSRQGVRDFWTQVAKNLQERKRYAEIKPKGKERLCTVCTVKRFVQREVLESQFGVMGGFPSTSEVAASSFKKRLLEALWQNNFQVGDALSNFIQKAQPLIGSVAAGAMPYLESLASKVGESYRDLASDLLKLDGEYFFTDTWTRERLQEVWPAITENDIKAGRERLAGLYKVVGTSPSKYYAILHMDGDRAGWWLSGTHEGLTSFGDILHPKVREELEKLQEWKALLRTRRIISPAVQAAISDALTQFALKIVRWVVGERYAGRLVYAGGDDVLALLPLDQALSVARELRALFSGQVKLQKALVDYAPEELLPVEFHNNPVSGYLVYSCKSILQTMGPTATVSIGLPIAHHLQPLDAVLRSSRNAEYDAKELYCRNALCIHLLKHSGEEMCVGAKWFYKGLNQDTVALITDICERLRDGRLSMKVAHAVFEEARTLSDLPQEAQKAELKRLFKRHAEGLPLDKREMQAKELSTKLSELAGALDTHRAKVNKPGFEQMAEWLLLARFLAQGGEG